MSNPFDLPPSDSIRSTTAMGALRPKLTIDPFGYELIARCGKGGEGEVWKARDPQGWRDLALKFLPLKIPRSQGGV